MPGIVPERVDISRAADCVVSSWAALDRELADAVTDPAACLPFIQPGTTTFYWELHFQEKRLTRVDFLHRPPLLPAGGTIAQRSLPDVIPERLASWYSTNEAARRYCHPSVWLELDGPVNAVRGMRRQGVSVCVDPRFGGRRGAESLAPPPPALIALVTGLEEACDTGKSRARLVAELQNAVGAARGTLRHVSIMRGRAGQPIKIYAAIPKPSFPAFLSAIGWPGNRVQVLRLAELVTAESQQVNVDLGFDEELTTRIGFEIFSDPSPVADPGRTLTTGRAVALGLISQRAAEALRRWVGTVRRPFASDLWPTTVQRWFDLKFVDLGTSGLEFKVYLGFRMCDGIFG